MVVSESIVLRTAAGRAAGRGGSAGAAGWALLKGAATTQQELWTPTHTPEVVVALGLLALRQRVPLGGRHARCAVAAAHGRRIALLRVYLADQRVGGLIPAGVVFLAAAHAAAAVLRVLRGRGRGITSRTGSAGRSGRGRNAVAPAPAMPCALHSSCCIAQGGLPMLRAASREPRTCLGSATPAPCCCDTAGEAPDRTGG